MNQPEQEAAMPRRAYSYTRFSHAAQAAGDSIRRQEEWTKKLCEEKGWILDDSLQFSDRGVSAHHGRNSSIGQLGQFLQAVKRGRIARGSVLVVENLDRLSREEIDDAYDLFRSIIRAGITIATREPRREYGPETKGDMLAVLEPLFLFARGHSESAAKAMRIGEAWVAARRAAAEHRRPHQCRPPGWIRREGDRYVLIPDRAEAVRRLFALAPQGYGYGSLARKMTEEGRPSISVTGRWDSDTVKTALTRRGAVGEYQPKRRREGSGRTAEGPPIANFYPAIVSEEEWQLAQAAIAGRRNRCGRPARRQTNLFVGLVVDAASGRRLSLKNKQRAGKRYPYLRYASSSGTAIEYQKFEDAVLDTLAMIRPEDVMEPCRRTDERERRIAELTARTTALEHRLGQLQEDAADPEKEYLLPSLAKVSAELKAATKEKDALKLESMTGRAEALTETQSLVELRRDAKGEERAELDRRIKVGATRRC